MAGPSCSHQTFRGKSVYSGTEENRSGPQSMEPQEALVLVSLDYRHSPLSLVNFTLTNADNKRDSTVHHHAYLCSIRRGPIS